MPLRKFFLNLNEMPLAQIKENKMGWFKSAEEKEAEKQKKAEKKEKKRWEKLSKAEKRFELLEGVVISRLTDDEAAALAKKLKEET